MATDMFLKLTGIEGESTVDAHQDEIDVLTWTMGLAQSGGAQAGGGRGAGKVHVQDLALTKPIPGTAGRPAQTLLPPPRITQPRFGWRPWHFPFGNQIASFEPRGELVSHRGQDPTRNTSPGCWACHQTPRHRSEVRA